MSEQTDHVAATSSRAPRPRLDLDVRGLLALMSMVGCFVLAIVQVAVGDPRGAEIPSWSVSVLLGVCGFYFGSRSASGGGYTGPTQQFGRRSTDDVPLTQPPERSSSSTVIGASLLLVTLVAVLMPVFR